VTGGAGTVPAPVQVLVAAPVAAAAAAYAAGVIRLHLRGDRWPRARSAAAVAGFVLLLVAPAPLQASAAGFPLEAAQHVVATMVAPAALALAAPVTLALRTLPTAGRRRLLAAVRSRAVRAVTSAPLVLTAAVAGTYAYYLTPLFAAAHHRPWLHAAVHGHMFAAGCLLSWYLVGRDPMPRAPVGRRLAVLLVAAGAHDALARLMYAHGLPEHAGPLADVRLGAQILFYGGDVVTVVLAAAVMSQWYAREGRRVLRARRQAASQAAPGRPPAAGSPPARAAGLSGGSRPPRYPDVAGVSPTRAPGS
jgi:putative membrane protein